MLLSCAPLHTVAMALRSSVSQLSRCEAVCVYTIAYDSCVKFISREQAFEA